MEKMTAEFLKDFCQNTAGSFSVKYIRRGWNSSRRSIRILVGNAAAADCGIPLEF
jgi:hypothetical protein